MAGERLPFQPERNNIIPSERGGLRLEITTHDRPSTPTREAPPPPTKETRESSPELQRSLKEMFEVYDRPAPAPTDEEVKAANNGEYAGSTRTVERVAGKWPGRIAVTSGVAFVGVTAYVGNEIYRNSALHERVESFSNTFNSQDGPQLVASSPEKQPSNPKITNYDNKPIEAQKFKIPPPNRIPSEDMSPKHLPIEQLGTIKEHKVIPPGSTINYYKPGINFQLEERHETSIARRVTPQGIEPITQEFTYYPDITVAGYVIGKEIQPDGTVLLAIYAPGENGLLSNQDDAISPVLSVKNIKEDGKQGKIYNTIVWLKAENFAGYSPPFYSNATWHDEESVTNGVIRGTRDKTTNIPEELFKYIQIGDTLSTAGGMLVTPPWAEDLLVENYQERESALTYEKAKEKYSNIEDNNKQGLQRMLEDAKTGDVSLQEQLDDKRYIIQASSIHFVPRD